MATNDPELQEQYDEVERELLERWPETRMDPTLDRVRALTELLGDPQRAYPVVQLTGTNGKTSTARMIETLLREFNLRTGRFTSPHLESMTERITLDGAPVSRCAASSRCTRTCGPTSTSSTGRRSTRCRSSRS